jgi:hydroxymethylpyrimidine/phosphomethylpyrimidine kinase
MSPQTELPQEPPADAEDQAAPACVLSFNVNDPTGASGIAADLSTMASMGVHTLPVVTGVLIRDTTEVLESHDIDPDVVAEQARVILEDAPISAWKVGFLGSAEGVSAVAEILADYPDVPLVSYITGMNWLDEERLVSYQEAFKELILPATTVLVGSHATLSDLLLPDWESERPASARELAVAANGLGAQYVLVTGIQLPDQFIDNVLASAQGPMAGERFERFEASFVGAGETLSAALTAILANTEDVGAAVSESLAFLDQALDAGFRPGMGGVIPDRFFWAVPPEEAAAQEAAALAAAQGEAAQSAAFDELPEPNKPRHVH